MNTRFDYEDLTRRRLLNSLKGQAMMCKNQNAMMASIKEKRAEMAVIAEFVKYIENYEDNQRRLREYADMQRRLEDDGR